MASIVTYDVPEQHEELKAAMFKKGYTDKIPGENCKIIYFPNTCLHHEIKTTEEARDDVKAICEKLKIDLERCIATTWKDWAVICGESFKTIKKIKNGNR